MDMINFVAGVLCVLYLAHLKLQECERPTDSGGEEVDS